MDLALAERENTILGQDFLTWLWHVTEARGGVFKDKDGREFNLRMEERLSVQGGVNHVISIWDGFWMYENDILFPAGVPKEIHVEGV